jgi:hypothetical protein
MLAMENAKAKTGAKRMTGGTTRSKSDPLFKHVGALADFSSALISLAQAAPDRMTMSQGVFFLLAAGADLAGRPTTFTEIRETAGPSINRSMHTTYKVLLDEPLERVDAPRQKCLGWLQRHTNPLNGREKFLTLTPKGREIIREVLSAITGENL